MDNMKNHTDYTQPNAVLRGFQNEAINDIIFFDRINLITGTGNGVINIWNLDRKRVESQKKSHESSLLSLSLIDNKHFGRYHAFSNSYFILFMLHCFFNHLSVMYSCLVLAEMVLLSCGTLRHLLLKLQR